MLKTWKFKNYVQTHSNYSQIGFISNLNELQALLVGAYLKRCLRFGNSNIWTMFKQKNWGLTYMLTYFWKVCSHKRTSSILFKVWTPFLNELQALFEFHSNIWTTKSFVNKRLAATSKACSSFKLVAAYLKRCLRFGATAFSCCC